jgi:hypothetical protein
LEALMSDFESRDTYSVSQLSRLLRVIAAVTHTPQERLLQLAEVLLHHPRSAAPGRHGASDLCANGSPLQALLSAREDRWVVRLIADPAFDRSDPLARLAASREALAALLTLGQATALEPLVGTLLDTLLPKAEADLRAYPTGMLRLGTTVEARGVAVYAGPSPNESPWQAAARWAIATFREPTNILRTISTLATDCSLLGVGIEGTNHENARAKLYWRPAALSSLQSFGIPLFQHPALLRFLADILGGAQVPLGALNFSAGFSPHTGQICDIKVDVARHDLTVGDALQLVNEHAQRLELSPPPLHGLLSWMCEERIGAACVGLGVDATSAFRLNTYLYQR